MTSARSARARRWLAVVAVAAVLVALPWTIAHRPLPADGLSAAELLTRVQHSTAIGYSGYAESQGTLALPVTSQVNGLDDLLGGRTTMRVWWRGALDWRVDQISTFGESDVHRDTGGTWTWNYENNRATRADQTAEPAARIPLASDLLPPELGRRLLSEASADEVRRLAVRRIAGVNAPGLRLSTESMSSVDHVDVYAQPRTGLPLEVDVYGRASTLAAVRTSFLDLTVAPPATWTTGFDAPAGARVEQGSGFDLVSAADRFFAAGQIPPRLAGLTQNSAEQLPAVGVYGRGVTELTALPLGHGTTERFAHQLADAGAAPAQLLCAHNTACGGHLGAYQEITVGALSLLLLQPEQGRPWALAGTVLPATMRTAARQLLAHPVFDPQGR